MARLQIYDQCKDLCAYAAYRGTEAISVILFRRENNNVIVLNQQTHLDALEISRFAAAIFSRYKSVAVISFWGLMPIQGRVPFPSHRNYCLPEVVVTLPESPEAYLSSFGKHLRYDIRRNLKKLKQTFPSFSVQTYVKSEIKAQHISDIIALNNARMEVKKKVSYNSDEQTQRLFRLAQVYGQVMTVSIDDRLCAGTVGYCVGSTCFGQVLAHDPRYNGYKLGLVCSYLSMCELMARGVRKVRLGGSTHRYKFDFQGILLHLEYLLVYRSWAHFVWHAPRALPMSMRAYLGRAKLWLLLAEQREDFISRVAARIVKRLREFKR